MNLGIRFLSIVTSCLAISCSNHKQTGIRDAKSDFAKGIMRIETYGLPSPKDPYEEHLRQNGVEMKTVAGCIVDEEILGHAEGYNLTMKRLINRKLGKDLFNEAKEYTAVETSRKAEEND